MAGMKISELDFLRLLPAFMRDDEAVVAISKAINTLLGEPAKRLQTLRTWDKMDELTEAECDEMAWEFDVDWYDSAGMSLEEKRSTLKMAQQIKSKRGTKWAVEQLIATYFGEGYIAEWYELGNDQPYSQPYTFIVLSTNPEISEENYDKFVQTVNYAKNARSHLAGIFYYWQQGPEKGIECAPGDKLHRYDFVKCGTRHRVQAVGCLFKMGIEAEVEETSCRYGFPECGAEGFAATVGAPIVGTAITDKSILAH